MARLPSYMEPFTTLVHAHGPAVWQVCRALCHPVDVDDAWQETFLAALASYPTTRVAHPRAWLIGIAHHKCMDAQRRRYREALFEVEDDDVVASDGVNERHLWMVVAQLPPKQRHVIAYRYLGGLTYGEIARILGGSPAAARRAAADGINTLRGKLAT
ncbi:MAG TPA: RNA polymerase sigma factor [Beutenbergiaceae bacterium]|nr:RNA polymerase sigma factor [Beutenbergiaceae bacterium]